MIFFQIVGFVFIVLGVAAPSLFVLYRLIIAFWESVFRLLDRRGW